MKYLLSAALGIFVISMAFVSSASTKQDPSAWRTSRLFVAAADTDSVAVDTLGLDSLALDSLLSDTLGVDSLVVD